MKKSVKLACHLVNSNIAIGFLPTLQISLGIVALFEKIYDGEPIHRLFKYRGGCTTPLFQLSVSCEKGVTARHYSGIGKQLQFANDINRVRSFRPLTGWGLHQFVRKFQRE
jgi:hypothetical protein